MTNIPMTQAGIGGLGPWELIIVLLIVLVVFGAGKLPQVGNSIGQAIKNFKKGMTGSSDESSSKESKNENRKESDLH